MKPIQYAGAKMAIPNTSWVGLIENSLLVSVAAGLTWATQHVGAKDFGQYTPLVVAVASIVLGYLQKVINNPVVPTPTPTPVPSPNNNSDLPIG